MFSEVYLLFGAFLLIAGLGFALKVGIWVWVATRFFGRPAPAPAPESSPSTIDNFKKWLAIISTVLGIISTSVGLLEKCNPSSATKPAVAPYTSPVAPSVASYCCTPQGRCMMMIALTPGSVCTCVGMFGAFQGTACN